MSRDHVVSLDSFAYAARWSAGALIAAEASSIHADGPAVDYRVVSPRSDAASAQPSRNPMLRRMIGVMATALLASLAIGGRHQLVAKIPGADRVFSAIGLPVNLAGIEFRNVASQIAEIDGRKVLAVTGEAINVRPGASASLPSLEVTVRGADQRALYVWTAPSPKSALQSGESVAFRTRLAAPPEGARDVVVRLAPTVKIARMDTQTQPKAASK